MNNTVILERRPSWWRRMKTGVVRETVICGLGSAFSYIKAGYHIDWHDTERAHLAARSALQEPPHAE